MLSEMCPQLQLSTSISPRCLRDVSKDLFHLWLFWPLRSPLGFKYFPSLSSGAGTLKLRITQCVPLPLTVRAMLPDKQDRLEVEDLALLSRSMSGAVRILASMALLLLCGIQFCAALDSCLSWAFDQVASASTVCLMLVVQAATCCDHVRRCFVAFHQRSISLEVL